MEVAVQQDQCIWNDLDMCLADCNAHGMAGCFKDGEIAWLKRAPPVAYNGLTRTAAVQVAVVLRAALQRRAEAVCAPSAAVTQAHLHCRELRLVQHLETPRLHATVCLHCWNSDMEQLMPDQLLLAAWED